MNGLRKHWKLGLSLLLVIHLMAVVAEPFQFFTRSPRGVSEAARPIRGALAPYVEFAYLSHGYFFFAPNPGPSHLLRCRLELSEGEEKSIYFPDREMQWPRLLYHRHFMLAEFLHQLHVPPVDEELIAGQPTLAAEWRADRQRFVMVRDAMIRHLKKRYGVDDAQIDRVEHRLPSSQEVLVEGLRLDDPSLYVTLPDEPPVDMLPAEVTLPAGQGPLDALPSMGPPMPSGRWGREEVLP